MSFDKILIAVDGSERAEKAANNGFALARRLNAQVTLIFVINAAYDAGNPDAGITPTEAEETLKEKAESILSKLAALYTPNQLVKIVAEGDPAKEIMKVAAATGADLIVMGTHGRTGLLHLLTGSTAEFVVRHSKIPVMVVPAKGES